MVAGTAAEMALVVSAMAAVGSRGVVTAMAMSVSMVVAEVLAVVVKAGVVLEVEGGLEASPWVQQGDIEAMASVALERLVVAARLEVSTVMVVVVTALVAEATVEVAATVEAAAEMAMAVVSQGAGGVAVALWAAVARVAEAAGWKVVVVRTAGEVAWLGCQWAHMADTVAVELAASRAVEMEVAPLEAKVRVEVGLVAEERAVASRAMGNKAKEVGGARVAAAWAVVVMVAAAKVPAATVVVAEPMVVEVDKQLWAWPIYNGFPYQ
jgi:hypothetical protein